MVTKNVAANPVGKIIGSLGGLFNSMSNERGLEYNCIGMPVYVFVVLTVTDKGADIAAVYDNQAAAMEHIKRRFDCELENYKKQGVAYFDELLEPTWDHGGGSAYIQSKDDDYWSWTVVRVPLRATVNISTDG